MKTIVVYRNSMKASGGVERVISNLVNEWVKYYNVIILVKDDGNSFYDINKRVKIIAMNIPLYYDMNNRAQRIAETLRTILKTRKEIKNRLSSINWDYLYCTTPLNALEIFLLGPNYRKKTVVSEHGSYYAYNKIYHMIKRYIYPRMYSLSVPNKMDTELYKRWGCNVFYIPHIITFKLDCTNQLKDKIILNVGRLTKDKQQELLINIWNQIGFHGGWKLWIVGDGELKEKLEAQAMKSKNVELFPATKNISEYYKKASLFAFTSRMEGFGMVLLEAMSYGVPCISFDCPSGPRDIIKDGRNGILVRQGDIEEYKNRLEGILNNDENLTEYSREARRTVMNWNTEKIIEKWKKIYV